MKKVSTAAAKTSRKIAQQKLTVGLDLGDRNSRDNGNTSILKPGMILVVRGGQ